MLINGERPDPTIHSAADAPPLEGERVVVIRRRVTAGIYASRSIIDEIARRIIDRGDA